MLRVCAFYRLTLYTGAFKSAADWPDNYGQSVLSARLLSPVNKNILLGKRAGSSGPPPSGWGGGGVQTNKRPPPSSKTEAAQFQTGEIKISAILQRKPRGELHPGEGEEGNQLTVQACVCVCAPVFTGGSAFPHTSGV